MDLPSLMQTFLSMQQSAETRVAYAKDLNRWVQFAATIPGLVATMEDALAFRDALAEAGLATSTQARVWSTVKTYYRFLVQSRNAETSPFEYIKGPKKVSNVAPKTPSDADVALLVEAAIPSPPRSLIIALLLNGLRATEVCNLMRKDIETHEDTLFLRVTGKGMKQRLVPMTVEAQQAYARNEAFLTAAQQDSPFIVSDYDGTILSLRQLQHAVYKTAEYAGIEGMHPHALRHHYATRLIRAGASPLHVRDLLGHASVATTQVYVLLDLADLAKAAGLDPRNVQVPLAVTKVA